jgi:predicted DNA-binding protein YlxM (UPF0122 family)
LDKHSFETLDTLVYINKQKKYIMEKLNNLKILSIKEIAEKFNVSLRDMEKSLEKYDCDNFWYPYESGFDSEEDVNAVISFIKENYNDITIHDKFGYKYTEVVLSSVEHKVLVFSLIDHLTNE